MVQSKLGPRSAVVLLTSDVYRRNGDVNHEFRPDSDFWYLTGHPEPDTRLILTRTDFSGKNDIPFEGEIIFAQPRDPRWEQRNGKRLGAAGARNSLGFQYFAFTDSFESVLGTVIPHIDTLFVNRPRRLEAHTEGIVVLDAGSLIHPLRYIKSPEEVELLKKAVEITGEGIVNAMIWTNPEQFEYNVEAVVEFTFRDLGSVRLGFSSIIGSGPNATILHYTRNDRLIQKGDLLLMDVGAEHQMYTADITRTVPVTGKFTPEQREVYACVLNAQKAVFDSIRTGMTFRDLNRIARNYLRNKGFDRYLLHDVSHWLGLDVHDVGGRAPIEVGTVFTIEPGIYIAANDESLPKAYRGIGIRIEDDVLMTKKGPIWLSASIPKEIDEIERIMRRGRYGVRRLRWRQD